MDNSTNEPAKIAEGFIGQAMLVLPPDRQRAILANALSKNFYATAMGYYPHASHHDRERPNGSSQYILLYCVGGKGWIRLNDTEYQLIPNTYIILPKNIPHHYGSSLKEPWSIYWLHFTGKQADLLYLRYTVTGGGGPQNIPYRENRIELFQQIIEALENDLGNAEMELAYLKLLQFVGSFIYADNATAEGTESDVIAKSIRFMKQHLHKTLSTQELAGQANYSVSRYSELFRLKTGYAPIQYFIQMKIQKSCQYLYFSKMNIKEICKEIGFDDPYYFSRMFKKQMGMPPLQYRKMQKG